MRASEDESSIDDEFKYHVVDLILSKRTEEALDILATRLGVTVPRIRVGHWKGHKKVLAVYVRQKQTIFVAKNESMWDPFVILHEFYHHLRTRSGEHRGTEKLADAFALNFLRTYLYQTRRGGITSGALP